MKQPPLTLEAIRDEAAAFAEAEGTHAEPSLYGVTDGKAVGTYLEHKFRDYLGRKYHFTPGSSASGIDFPALSVDLKVTSAKQPQSSCPFKSARQKIYGLGYSLLVFVYEKSDDRTSRTATLNILHTIFIDSSRAADYQMTRGLLSIVASDGNTDDVIAFLGDRMLPVDEIQAQQLAEEILANPPEQGYLTISNALQWRLQYSRAIDVAGSVGGVIRLR